MTNLVRMDVSHNRLQGLPEEILGCTSLRILYLGANHFETFPETVSGLPELRRLYLGSNSLRSIPDCVAALQNLEVLYLGGNRLQHLTKYIDRLAKLTLLYLGDNVLKEIPSLSGLSTLRTLNLHNNRLTVLPPSVRFAWRVARCGLLLPLCRAVCRVVPIACLRLLSLFCV